MTNIMDYMDWRGDISLKVSPFNEVDNVILSQIVYLDWEEILPEPGSSEKITLEEAARLYFRKFSPEDVDQLPMLKKECSHLLIAMAKSVRFSDAMLFSYVNDVSSEEEFQFSAMCIQLSDRSIYISFSGTDHTVAGWKENFNLSYVSETPGQLKAVAYVENTAAGCRNKLRIGGHSKGGNLAVYAGMHVRKGVQNRILDIYNNDGPGFTKKMISEEGYQRILNRVHTFLPQSSIVGMLLNHEEKIEVIQSTNRGIMQHHTFSWQVKGTKLIHLEGLERDSIFVDDTLKNWLSNLDLEQRKQFVDSLFTILAKAEIEDTDTLSKMSWKQFLSMAKIVEALPVENKEVLTKTLKSLFDAGVGIATKEASIIPEMFRGGENLSGKEKTGGKIHIPGFGPKKVKSRSREYLLEDVDEK